MENNSYNFIKHYGSNNPYSSININETCSIVAPANEFSDIPENINVGSWVLIITFINSPGTGVQFATSLFSSQLRLYKRHIASGKWSDFVLTNGYLI